MKKLISVFLALAMLSGFAVLSASAVELPNGMERFAVAAQEGDSEAKTAFLAKTKEIKDAFVAFMTDVVQPCTDAMTEEEETLYLANYVAAEKEWKHYIEEHDAELEKETPDYDKALKALQSFTAMALKHHERELGVAVPDALWELAGVPVMTEEMKAFMAKIGKIEDAFIAFMTDVVQPRTRAMTEEEEALYLANYVAEEKKWASYLEEFHKELEKENPDFDKAMKAFQTWATKLVEYHQRELTVKVPDSLWELLGVSKIAGLAKYVWAVILRYVLFGWLWMSV